MTDGLLKNLNCFLLAALDFSETEHSRLFLIKVYREAVEKT